MKTNKVWIDTAINITHI